MVGGGGGGALNHHLGSYELKDELFFPHFFWWAGGR